MVAQHTCLRSLAQVDNETGDCRLYPAAAYEIEGQPDHNPDEHDLVGPEHASVHRGAGEAGHPGDEEDDREGRARRGRRHAGPAVRPRGPEVPLSTDAEQGDGQRDGRPRSHSDVRDAAQEVREDHRRPLGPALEAPTRVRKERVYERPSMEGEDVGRGERRRPGERQQETYSALRSPHPRDDATTDEDESHDEVRDGEGDVGARVALRKRRARERRPFGVEAECNGGRKDGDAKLAHQAMSARSAAPLSSAFARKPRAAAASRRGP